MIITSDKWQVTSDQHRKRALKLVTRHSSLVTPQSFSGGAR